MKKSKNQIYPLLLLILMSSCNGLHNKKVLLKDSLKATKSLSLVQTVSNENAVVILNKLLGFEFEKFWGGMDKYETKDLRYEIKGRYTRPVKKTTLHNAASVGDFIFYYPTNWITNYDSVKILATCNGKIRMAVSPDNHLTREQKNILNTVEPGADIIVNVSYKYKNTLTGKMEDSRIFVTMTVIPELEAQYIGGNQEMRKYIEGKIMSKVSKTIPRQYLPVQVLFTVNGEGEITNIKMPGTTGEPETDQSLFDAIYNMPRWKPAENSEGKKVEQEFEFSISLGGC